jgi:UDP-N-acetylmuramate--alanine ligase
MHIYFSGIGGAAIGPLALIAKKAGYSVSGSDKQINSYLEYLKKHGITDIHVGQSYDQIADVHTKEPIDWFVYTSALPIENPDAPELRFCTDNNIRATKRDIFLNTLLEQKKQKLVAVAGTHGKTTTTAMAIWLFKQLRIPVNYSVGAKFSFGDMGEFSPEAEYFVYEADEFDRNFLAFKPRLSLITGIDWDHPDIYPTRESYNQAFRQFLTQSEHAFLWKGDVKRLDITPANDTTILDEHDPAIDTALTLPGGVNRLDAWQVAHAVARITNQPFDVLLEHLNRFPGVSRRFERLAKHIYSDYAHTPPKIRGALQLAEEVAPGRVVVIYEGLHNTRQHFIKDELRHLFDGVNRLYVVPSYLAREDPNLALLSTDDLVDLLSTEARSKAEPANLDDSLKQAIRRHAKNGDLILALSAGGGGSLDEWLRKKFVK